MNTPCFVCDNNSSTYLYTKGDQDLYRCSNCGLIFVWPKLDNTESIYGSSYFLGTNNATGYADYEGDKDIIVKNFKKYLDKIEHFLQPSGKLFDVGAATGHFIEQAKKRGWKASGIEISKSACNLCLSKKLIVEWGNFENYMPIKNDFSVLTFLDVFEHFNFPEKAILNASKMLANGGIIAINTPDTASFIFKILGEKWHLLDPPEHLNYFNSGNIKMLLKKYGFDVIFIGRVGKKFSIRYIFKTLKKFHNLSMLKKIFDYVAVSRIGSLGISINLRDNMFIIARKK
jgi:SAM-dependent methyltransferase